MSQAVQVRVGRFWGRVGVRTGELEKESARFRECGGEGREGWAVVQYMVDA